MTEHHPTSAGFVPIWIETTRAQKLGGVKSLLVKFPKLDGESVGTARARWNEISQDALHETWDSTPTDAERLNETPLIRAFEAHGITDYAFEDAIPEYVKPPIH